jgi:hypothetical protein
MRKDYNHASAVSRRQRNVVIAMVLLPDSPKIESSGCI